MANVAKWDIFDLALTGPSEGNPYLDVALEATFSQGGTTVNGEKSTVWPLAPKDDAERY